MPQLAPFYEMEINLTKRHGPYSVRMARTLAFLGRYAHQQASEVLKMYPDFRDEMVSATAALLEDENKATRGR